jgi:hypothetical protein
MNHLKGHVALRERERERERGDVSQTDTQTGREAKGGGGGRGGDTFEWFLKFSDRVHQNPISLGFRI